MPSINFKKPVTSALGAKVVLGDGMPQANLGEVVVMALGKFSPRDQREGVPPGESYTRGELAARIRAAKGGLELGKAEVDLIKKCVENFFSPEVVTPVWNMLEGK